MNGTPTFDLMQYIELESGHLTGAVKDNLTQLYDRIATYQNTNIKMSAASDVDPITPDNNYIGNQATVAKWQLPTVCEVGSQFGVTNIGAGGWEILIGTGQNIIYGGASGATKLAGTGIGTYANLMCVLPNTTYLVTSHEGSLTLT